MAAAKAAQSTAYRSRKKVKKSKAAREIGENERKWGSTTHSFGWTYVPNLLLEHQAELGLQPIHLNIILSIMKHWWQRDSLPWPTVSTVANSIGRSRNLVQKRIAELEELGLIKRNFRKDARKEKQSLSNEYDFTGLVSTIATIAKRRQKAREAVSRSRKS